MSGEPATRTEARGRDGSSPRPASPTPSPADPEPAPLALHVRCFPTDDVAFEAIVQRRLGSVKAMTRDEVAIELGARLAAIRDGWPAMRVQLADPLASPPGETIVYVFRDGAVIPTPQA